MGEFDHVPTPDANELNKMFEADGGVAAQSVEDLHEAAAREAVLEHQRREELLASSGRREAARAQVEQAAGPVHTEQAGHLRDIRLRRGLVEHADSGEAPVRAYANPATQTEDARDTMAMPALGPDRVPEDRDKVVREVFKKQMPSAWTPEAKRLAAKEARKAEKQAREPLHRRAARFIGSKLKGKGGKHEKNNTP